MKQQGYYLNICINDRGFINKTPQINYGICPTLRAQTHGNEPKVIKALEENEVQNERIQNNKPD